MKIYIRVAWARHGPAGTQLPGTAWHGTAMARHGDGTARRWHSTAQHGMARRDNDGTACPFVYYHARQSILVEPLDFIEHKYTYIS